MKGSPIPSLSCRRVIMVLKFFDFEGHYGEQRASRRGWKIFKSNKVINDSLFQMQCRTITELKSGLGDHL